MSLYNLRGGLTNAFKNRLKYYFMITSYVNKIIIYNSGCL